MMPAMAGHPGTPLPKKLGIKAGHKVCLLNAPAPVQRRIAIDEVRVTHDLRLSLLDVIVLFVDKVTELERRILDIRERMHPTGGCWIAFRTNRGDVTNEVARRIALAAGMVDNKTCTIRGGWTAIRFVLRESIRDAVMYRVVLTRRRAPTMRLPRPLGRTLSRPASADGSSVRRARGRRSSK